MDMQSEVNSLRNHKLVVWPIKGERAEEFELALRKYVKDNGLVTKNLFRRNQKYSFTLVGTMEQILCFLKDFAPVWNVSEEGESEFARIMEISDIDSFDWHGIILEYRGMLRNKVDYEGGLVKRFMAIDSVEKLQYLKRFFTNEAESLLDSRIAFLRGEESDMDLYAMRQLEKQELLAMLKDKDQLSGEDMKRLLAYLESSD